MNKILIIEDIENTILLIESILEEIGVFETIVARNGTHGIELATERSPDLILLDISMPVISGFDVCIQLKNNPLTCEIPIVFLSAFNETDKKIKAFELGAADYITKPFNANELIVRIKTQLRLFNLKMELLEKNKKLVENQNMFQNFINYSAAWEAFHNTEGKLLFCTPAFETITGYKLTDLISGEIKTLDFIVAKYKDSYNQHFHKALNGENFEHFEFALVTKNNQIKYLSKTVNQVFTDIGERTGFRSSITDITQQKLAQEARNEAEKKIITAIITAEENERLHFARELHDGLGPLLSTVKMNFEWLNKPDLKTPKENILARINASITEAIATVREISQKLSPQILTNFGLVFALKSFIEKINQTQKIKIHFETNITERIENELEITIYRAVLECINNTIKHAKAENIKIKVIKDNNKIKVNYSDDGKGFNVNEIMNKNKGLGLFNLQNRIVSLKGIFNIESEINKGVKILFSVENSTQNKTCSNAKTYNIHC